MYKNSRACARHPIVTIDKVGPTIDTTQTYIKPKKEEKDKTKTQERKGERRKNNEIRKGWKRTGEGQPR